jgi:hypothetical protein
MQSHDQARLTFEECSAKAAECRAMAEQAWQDGHRVMLEHIAETWERISAEMKILH